MKTAKAVGVEARAFDTSGRLIEAARQRQPSLVLMDCEGLEKEAFHLLDQFRSDEKLSAVSKIGYLSHTAQDLKQQMRTAGCSQVYSKAELSRELENILARYSDGFSSRI